MVLSVYRFLGYGERFVPPMIVYLLAVAIAALLSFWGGGWDLSEAGWQRFGDRVSQWAISPLHIINAGEVRVTLGSLWLPVETALKVVIVVPFVTFVLALRHFAKREVRA